MLGRQEMQAGTTANPWGTGTNGTNPPRKAFRAKLTTTGEVAAQVARLYREARSGVISVEDASRLANVLSILGRMLNGAEIEALAARLDALEGAG